MSVVAIAPAVVQSRDEDLVLLAAGDSRAVVSLYQRHAADLYRFIARRVNGPAEDVEELLQDTMIAAVAGAGRFRGDCSTRTWLCSIALKQILQRRRTELRKKRIPSSCTVALEESTLEALHASQATGSPLPSDAAERLAVREMVQGILGEMDEIYREVMILRYVEEFSVREIGAMLGKSERAVEGLLRRARLQAREIGARYL